MKNYDVIWLNDKYKRCGDRLTPVQNSDEAEKIVKEYIEKVWPSCIVTPKSGLKHGFVTPGGGYDTMWDWDSFFISCGLPDEAREFVIGTSLNFLNFINPKTGKPAKNVRSDGTQDPTSELSHPYPKDAQFSYILGKRYNDFSWIEPYYETLEKTVEWYDKNTLKNGYYVWKMYGCGIDNNPAVYGRPDSSGAGPDLVSFMYREFIALAKLSKIFGKGKEDRYFERAKELKEKVQRDYFDRIDKCFYAIDCNFETPSVCIQKVNWITYLKYKSFATVFPLWGGLATKEQAKCMRDLIMDENEFLSVCGIRSHTKNDPVYNNDASGNPSNWQGPVWGLSTFLTAYGLARYGYKQEALEVAGRLIKTFAGDIKENGGLHEFYDGDNGQPVMRLGFLSWNLLAYKVMDDLRNGTDCTSEDLLDF